jgi:hypothetical protein
MVWTALLPLERRNKTDQISGSAAQERERPGLLVENAMPRLSLLLPVAFTAVLWGVAAEAQERRRQSAASARPAEPRAWMEQCTDGVMRQLARARVPEAQVGPTVAYQCDAPLRAVLAQAIQTGEASICTVESCIGLARSRVADEVLPAYRELLANPPPEPTRPKRR